MVDSESGSVIQTASRQRFENVYELKLFMHNLQNAVGTKYKIDRVEYFTRYTEEYDKFMYRKVAYRCCGVSPSDPCFSYLVVEFHDDCLEIVECYPNHTHSNHNAPRTPPFVILTGGNYVEPDLEFIDAFKKLFENVTFTSFEMLQRHLDEFHETTGACYIRRHTTKLPDSHIHATTCVYRRLTLECKRSGTFKSRSERGICGKSKMINCPAKINFVYENGILKILNYNLSHNHLLVPAPVPKKSRPHRRKTIFKSETGFRNLPTQIPTVTASTILRRRKRMLIKDSVYNPELTTIPVHVESKQPAPQLSRLRQLMTEVMNQDSFG